MNLNFLDLIFLAILVFSLLRPALTGDIGSAFRFSYLLIISGYFSVLWFTHPKVLNFISGIFTGELTILIAAFLMCLIGFFILLFILIYIISNLVYMVPVPFFSNIAATLLAGISTIFMFFLLVFALGSIGFINKTQVWQESYTVKKLTSLEKRYQIKQKLLNFQIEHEKIRAKAQ